MTKLAATMRDGKTPRCQAEVWGEHTSSLGSSQCSYRGKVERDGKWYCKIHDPVAKIEKFRARQAERIAERAYQERVRVARQNDRDRKTVLEFLDRLEADPWLAETLAALSTSIGGPAERASQFIELVSEKARQWNRKPIPEGK